MEDIKARIVKLQQDYEKIKDSLNLDEKKLELKKLETATTDPAFWRDQEKARGVMQEIGDLKREIGNMAELQDGVEMLAKLAETGGVDASFLPETAKLEKLLSQLVLTSFLADPYDKKNALVAIHAGQGGVEAMDWASMLYRMYLRFCERRGWQTETVEVSEGEEAGIKSVTFRVEGSFAYGYLKGEAGTHRLVRQSPFNADKLRQTSFALVGVLPELEDVDLPGVEIKDADLDWQFFRSSSQGGQNVQKVSTAVRVIHKPTGVAVTAQTQRFQEQNRKIALTLLRGKLWVLEKEKKEKKVAAIKGEYRPASWGNQIRSYVLHPYKMVKDLRTEVEVSNPEAVLAGELDEFIEAELKLAVNR